ncbi:MAG: serine hydrolase, partial [Cohnella sp.]|nr:serine hydrolase [Cohnella sp.]
MRADPYSRIDSILIVRNGYLVTEVYAPYKTKDDHYDLYSATKSVISALVGIAINDGYIPGVEAKVMDYFPEYRNESLDPRKETITIRDLLRMSAGFESV